MSRSVGAGASAMSEYGRRRRLRRRLRFGMGLCGAVLVAAAAVLREGGSRPAGGHWVHPSPLGWVLAAAGVGLWALLVFLPDLGGGDIGRWERGAAGERRTALVLESLPGRRWSVWHDLAIPGSRANIDHVVVGRTGVWVVDTKTTRAAVSRRWRSVRFGERRLDTTALRWEASVLADMLAESGGLDGRRTSRALRRAVRPVVALDAPGLDRPGRAGGVPVVATPSLCDRVRRGRRRLGRRDRQLVVEILEERFGPAAAGSGATGRGAHHD